MDIFNKNRKRELPIFANINLLGKCNMDCYFCLGKDIPELLNQYNHLNTKYHLLPNYQKFLSLCKENSIQNIYITGQNTDALCYKDLTNLINNLHSNDFKVGIRTNGLLALREMDTINLCNRSVGYSIHTLNPTLYETITGIDWIPDWAQIFELTTAPMRVSIVAGKYNHKEVFDIIQYLSQWKDKIKYVQVRRISTDTRKEEMREDAEAYDTLYSKLCHTLIPIDKFYDADIFEIYGMKVCFWMTVSTSINSFNYFTDGTISKEYFVVEGYLNNYMSSPGRKS